VTKVGQQQQQRTTFSVILKFVGFCGHRGSISTQMGPVDDARHAKLLISLYVDGAVMRHHITIWRLSFTIREIYSDGLWFLGFKSGPPQTNVNQRRPATTKDDQRLLQINQSNQRYPTWSPTSTQVQPW